MYVCMYLISFNTLLGLPQSAAPAAVAAAVDDGDDHLQTIVCG